MDVQQEGILQRRTIKQKWWQKIDEHGYAPVAMRSSVLHRAIAQGCRKGTLERRLYRGIREEPRR